MNKKTITGQLKELISELEKMPEGEMPFFVLIRHDKNGMNLLSNAIEEDMKAAIVYVAKEICMQTPNKAVH